jgi:hypothetical protein
LGGIWGFYLGFSAVTVLEFIEYIQYMFAYGGKRMCTKKPKKKTSRTCPSRESVA